MFTPGPNSQLFGDLAAAVAALSLEPHQLFSPATAVDIIRIARETSESPVKVMLNHPDFLLSRKEILRAVAAELQLEMHDFQSRAPRLHEDPDMLSRMEFTQLRQIRALPLLDPEGKVVTVVADPTNSNVTSYTERAFGSSAIALAPVDQILGRLTDLEAAASLTNGLRDGRSTNVSEWVDALLARAVAVGASDIHMEFTAEENLWIRFRIDGLLRTQPLRLTKTQGVEVMNSLIVRCPSIDVSDKTRPQDGTFSTEVDNRRIDTRVSTLPQLHGIKTVIRLLDSKNMRTRLDTMGFTPDSLTILREAAKSSQGLVLISGPTGSGKTTTLYGVLKEVDAVTKNVMTAEDPVEYRLDHISQTPVRLGLGDRSLTFAKILRAMMRQDPDVILVGEIRDEETAEVAANAAITGHLVLSTVHANSALEIVDRLRELGVAPSVLAGSVSLLIAQALMRKLHDCAVREQLTKEEAEILRVYGVAPEDMPTHVMHATGCGGCAGSGYLGRFAVIELVQPDLKMRRMITSGEILEDLTNHAKQLGYRSLGDEAYRRILEGVTTVAEMRRVIRDDS